MVDLPHRLGKYTLHRRIGSGGMGRVYLATLEGTGGFTREIAIKLIRAELAASERGTELFLREGRALAALSHRNIVQVFELDREGDQLYLAMEYLRGLDLAQIRARGPLAWQAACFLAAEAARGLAAAHAVRGPDAPEGIVHGDVSPSNVMACFDGAVKVLDFGIARPVGLAAASGVGGKLPYLPPEVIVGGAPDVRTDIYGLGLVLYEMLTGQRVYRAESDAEIIRRVMHDPVHAPSTHVPGLPPVLDQLVMTLVARDRAVRPGSAVDVAESLDRILAGRFGAADLATLVDKLATRTNESTTVTATPVGRTEPVDAARAGQHTAVATDSSVPLPRARRHWIAAIAGGVALAGGIAAWQLTARETAPSASEKTDTVVPMRTSEQPAPTADSPPTPAPSTPAATEAPSEAAPVAEPVRAAPAKRVVKRSRPSANKPSTPSTDPGPGSGGISPGYLANPFEKKK